MFDTHVTVIGNVITAPERRRTVTTQSLVTSFKVASTARRFNRETGQWVDGNSLRVRVTCWRRLAEGVAACVRVGDPVIVVGRLYTRDWVDEQQVRRVSYELDAVAVGHDLSKGQATFVRNKPSIATSMVEGENTETRAGDEFTEPVPEVELPDEPFDDDYPAYDPAALGRAYGSDRPSRADSGEPDGVPVKGGAATRETFDYRANDATDDGPGGDESGDGAGAAGGDDHGPDSGTGTTGGQHPNGEVEAESGRRRRGRGRAPVTV